jgi:hypothetical protein
MGYCVEMLYSDFNIPAKNTQDALKAIKTAFTGKGDIDGIKEEKIKKIHDLSTMMNQFRWEIEYDEDGNVVDLQFNGSWLGDYITFPLEAIAPYVKKGSYIEFGGEDSEMWRYVFDGKGMKEKQAKTIWVDA